MKKIFIIILFIFCLFLTGCRTEKNLKAYEDFRFYLSNDIAYVYDLSENGKTKDTIIFPPTINNYKTGLGTKFGLMVPSRVVIESQVINNLYFNSDIIKNTYSDNAVYFLITNTKNIRIFLPNTNQLIENVECRGNDLYYSNEFYKENTDIVSNLEGKIANLSYNYNYEKEFKTFFIDDLDGEKVKNIPPKPNREGYIFEGWYKEPECITKWDFDNDIVPAKIYSDDGKYLYNETILYAKWKNRRLNYE